MTRRNAHAHLLMMTALTAAGLGGVARAQDAVVTAAPGEGAPVVSANAFETSLKKIAAMQRQIDDQRAALDRQQAQIDQLKVLAAEAMDEMRGGQAPRPTQLAQVTPPAPLPGSPPSAAAPVAPTGPVGAPPPPDQEQKVEVASLPEGAGVLTPVGHGVIDTSFDYTHGSSNRLVFRGVEIVTGVQVGVIEASDADRNATSGAVGVRYGLTNRIEVEARVPYVYRNDRVTTLVQREQTATRTMDLTGKALGDIELAGRYQLNRSGTALPVFVANLRIKSNTGSSPFKIGRDEFGASTELATGSGFWAMEPSISFLYPTDPAVIFGSIGFLHSFASDIDRDVGGVHVGKVEPGDSVSASAGFGFALNPRFSFSLGYKHAYIMPTKTELGSTQQKSESLQVGGFTLGWSFRLSERLTLSNTYEIGTTRDAPDMRTSFRIPYRF